LPDGSDPGLIEIEGHSTRSVYAFVPVHPAASVTAIVHAVWPA
jgi:hypothetical protein